MNIITESFIAAPAEQAYKRVTQQVLNSDEKAGSKKNNREKKRLLTREKNANRLAHI